MTNSSGKYIFITLPRMGTKHVQDQLVRGLDVRDHVEGHETFFYRGREFRMSLGEYFRNYGFAENIVSNTYFKNGELHEDRERQYSAGLPADCYAYQIAYEGRWCFAKRNYINYYLISESDFREKIDLLRRFGKSYVIKILFNQHAVEQREDLLNLTKNVACYVKAEDILSWICSYSLIGRYFHSDPQSLDTTEVVMDQAKISMLILQEMLNFCRERDIPIVVNRGDDVRMFGCTIKNFVTREFSRFGYRNVIRNFDEVAALANQTRATLGI